MTDWGKLFECDEQDVNTFDYTYHRDCLTSSDVWSVVEQSSKYGSMAYSIEMRLAAAFIIAERDRNEELREAAQATLTRLRLGIQEVDYEQT